VGEDFTARFENGSARARVRGYSVFAGPPSLFDKKSAPQPILLPALPPRFELACPDGARQRRPRKARATQRGSRNACAPCRGAVRDSHSPGDLATGFVTLSTHNSWSRGKREGSFCQFGAKGCHTSRFRTCTCACASPTRARVRVRASLPEHRVGSQCARLTQAAVFNLQRRALLCACVGAARRFKCMLIIQVRGDRRRGPMATVPPPLKKKAAKCAKDVGALATMSAACVWCVSAFPVDGENGLQSCPVRFMVEC